MYGNSIESNKLTGVTQRDRESVRAGERERNGASWGWKEKAYYVLTYLRIRLFFRIHCSPVHRAISTKGMELIVHVTENHQLDCGRQMAR